MSHVLLNIHRSLATDCQANHITRHLDQTPLLSQLYFCKLEMRQFLFYVFSNIHILVSMAVIME